jgi:hypothetical protein
MHSCKETWPDILGSIIGCRLSSGSTRVWLCQRFLQDCQDAGSLQRLFLLIDATRRGINQENNPTTLDLGVMQWMNKEATPTWLL